MSNESKKLFTVVTDHDDGVSIEQFYASNLKGLLEEWHSEGFLKEKVIKLSNYDCDMTPIKNTKNVWCTSISSKTGSIFFVNVVLTVDA